MKAEDLKTKTQDELEKLLLEERKTLFNLRFQKNAGTLEKTSSLRLSRRNVARIKTVMTELSAKENGDSKKTGKAA